jgi:hypothetical protein
VYQQAVKLFGEADKINLWGLQDLEGFGVGIKSFEV